jgi:hypothetical protein
MVAGFHGRGTFHLRDTISTVPLPCEEKEFISGVSQDNLESTNTDSDPASVSLSFIQ